LLILVIFSSLDSFALTETEAKEKGVKIARMADKSNEGFMSEQNKIELTLITAHGDKTIRKMSSLIKEGKTSGDKSIMIFSYPLDVSGTKMLTWTHKTKSDDQWLYLPTLKRVKRIASKRKSGPFMGSEFSYEDFGSQEIEKYRYKWLKDENVNNRNTYLLERIPVDKYSGYKKQLVWMDKEYLNPIKIEYYDRKNELLKTGIFSGYKKVKNWWRVDKIEMHNHQTQKRSTLAWLERKLGVKVSDDEFDSDSLDD